MCLLSELLTRKFIKIPIYIFSTIKFINYRNELRTKCHPIDKEIIEENKLIVTWKDDK